MYHLIEYVTDFKDKNVQFAYLWAKKKHDDTYAIRNHSGEPYFTHPEGVAKLVLAYGGTFEDAIVALAHDTIEDAGATYEEIETLFGEHIANTVKEITNDRDEINKIGKELYINNELVTCSESALFVKLADIFYNILDYCTPMQFKRMKANILYLGKHRKLKGKIKDLYDDLLETIMLKKM